MKKILRQLIDLSKQAYYSNEIPVSAVIVKNNKIIGYGINSRYNDKSVLGHAEINAINMACSKIGDWRLNGCIMYVTLLPCVMCAGAILESRIDKVYYLCNKTNICFNIKSIINCERLDNDIYCNEYLNLLRLFFENKRN